jgi:outer membrane protein assembly factor BamD
MLARNLLLGIVTVISLWSCNRENFEKIRMNPGVDFRYDKAFQYYEKGDYQKAQYHFEDLMGIIKLSEKAEKVYYHYAMTHFKLKSFVSSSYYFKQFYNTFPNSAFAEEALFLSAESFERLSPNSRLTQEDSEKAIESYQLFVNTFPSSTRVSIGNEKIDKMRKKLEEKDLENAKGYFQRRDYVAANHCFKNMLVDFPDTKNAEYIRFMVLKSTYWYAKQSILERQVERFKLVQTEYEAFKRKHPNSIFLKEAESYNEISNQRIKTLRNERN